MRLLLSLSKAATVLPGDDRLEHAGLEEQGGDWDVWRYTVHSMNVLRLVFIDSTLADDITPYVTEVRRVPCVPLVYEPYN